MQTDAIVNPPTRSFQMGGGFVVQFSSRWGKDCKLLAISSRQFRQAKP
jgi:hypothetical protein